MRSRGGQTTVGAIAKPPRATSRLRRQFDDLTAELQALRIANAELEQRVAARVEALRANEASLDEAQQISHTGSWRWNVGTGEVSSSAELLRIFAFDATTQPSYATFMERIHADDRPLLEQMLDGAVRERRRFRHEFRIALPDGSIRHLQVVGQPDATKSGETEFVGTVMDITERKRAEEALQTSEVRWRRLFETSPVGMALATMEGRYIATNRAFQNMLGYTDKELKNLSPVDISPPDARHSTAQALADFADGKLQDYQIDRQYLRKDGTPLWVNVTVSVVPGSEFTPPSLLAIQIDVDDRKRAETGLRASEARWRTMFEMASVGIATFNQGQRFMTANPALQRMLGYSEDELRMLRGVDITVEDDRAVSSTLNDLIASGGCLSYQVEKRYRHKNGQVVWVNINAAVIPATDSTAPFYAAMILDITDRKRAEEALRDAQSELARVARLTTMGGLLASIAHEINQPLAAIATNGSACLRWLNRDDPDLDEARSAASRIMRDAGRAGDVIRGLRALATKSGPQITELDIDDAIQDVLALTRSELQRHGVVLHTELFADRGPIFGDRIQLQQVLLNLIMNGVDAMSAVTDRPRILTIKSRSVEPTGVRVAVEDTGAGLDQATADRIFEPFFTTKPKGMGMGLSICRSIIEAHGGRLWAAPNSPEGAKFEFTLPADATRAVSSSHED
jgi:PAS domain S-box-containing protein